MAKQESGGSFMPRQSWEIKETFAIKTSGEISSRERWCGRRWIVYASCMNAHAAPARRHPLRPAEMGLLLAAAGVPLSLLWDYSWESTVGIDLIWAPPHVATYLTVALAAVAALALKIRCTRTGEGVRLWRCAAPLGAWVALWGALAFVTAVLFDRWWQSAYGLAAGIWHPPQCLKAVSFLALTFGAWLCAPGLALGPAAVLALITVMILPDTFANRQHGAPFYLLACGAYPFVLAASANAGTRRFPSTCAALGCLLLQGAMVWLLPLFPAEPLTGPIFNPRDHMLPPPFPLLLVAPAFAIDLLHRSQPGKARRFDMLSRALEAGLAFWIFFTAAQWMFSSFLLSPAADNRFFAGGGRHWPFFLQIHPDAMTAFWPVKDAEFTPVRALQAAGLATLSALAGLWLGRGLRASRR